MTVKGYKALKSDWTCKGKQYRVGESYHEDEVELCKHGMHFCKNLKDIFRYYRYDLDMKLAMVEASGTVIQSGKDSKCVTSDLKIVKELNVNSEEVQLEAIKQNVWAIKHMDNPSKRVQLEAVKQDGWVIKCIDKPSEKVQLEAVKQDGWAIKFISSPNNQVQVEAVKQDGRVINFVNNLAKGFEGKK